MNGKLREGDAVIFVSILQSALNVISDHSNDLVTAEGFYTPEVNEVFDRIGKIPPEVYVDIAN